MELMEILDKFEAKHPYRTLCLEEGVPHLVIYSDGSGEIRLRREAVMHTLFEFNSEVELVKYLWGNDA